MCLNLCIFAVWFFGYLMMQMIDIREVDNRAALKQFIRFPRELYQSCPYYVPALDKAEEKLLTRHPALTFCDLRLWLALRGHKVVGRIAGIINHRCNELKSQRRIRFAWFDTVQDPEVAEALFHTVEEWGRREGLEEICGPSRFSNMEKQAMLVDGFDHITSLGADYNFSYYPEYMDFMGFRKEVDYVQFKVKVTPVSERITRMAGILSEKYHIRIRKIKDKEQLKRDGYAFLNVLNESYHNIFNFIPLTREEMTWVIEENLSVGVLDLISFLEDENGRLVGIAFCIPSLNQAFRKANGKMWPFGAFHILRALRRNKNVDMLLTGVLPEYAHTGIHAIYHKQLHEAFLQHGFEYAYTSQQLEDNIAARIWQKYDAEVISRRRCYVKEIGI